MNTDLFYPYLFKKVTNFNQKNINWTRGRFLGQIAKIVVIKGKIIEKVFLTPIGSEVSVKRCELGIICLF